MKQIGLVIAFTILLTFRALWFANSHDATAQQNVQNPSDVFAGKAITISLNDGVGGNQNRTSVSKHWPHRKFLVYQVSDDGQKPFDYWLATDEVSRIKVFPNMDDANAYYESQIAKRQR
ncbi:MAG TPA: hypothetical protein VM260_13035 [Pirellula sp.]|nr:hypothetical protein [Pirellula sp.]